MITISLNQIAAQNPCEDGLPDCQDSGELVEDNDPTTLFYGVDVVDQYFKTEQEAVAALWKQVLSIRQGKQKLPPEAVEDGIKPVPSSIIYWRSKPEIRVTRNGLVSVRMRAAFL